MRTCCRPHHLPHIACLLFAAGTAHAAVINVPANQPTIQAAINASVNGDEIVIAPGTYTEQLDLLGKSLILRGTTTPDQTIIDADGQLGVLIASSASVELRGLTFQNASSTNATGAGIIATNSALTITNCVLNANSVTEGTGAALAVVGGSVILTNSTIATNVASSSLEPAPFGAAVELRDTTATITGSRFESNQGFGVGGAALALVGTSMGTISASSFLSNSVVASSGALNADGGAIAVRDDAALTLSNSTFTTNFNSFGDGSAIDVGPTGATASIALTNCTFTGNSVTNGGNGTLAHRSSGAFSIIDSTFENNTATSGSGAGVALLTSATLPNGGALIDGCTFRGNIAAIAGAVQLACLASISDSLFENNQATGATSGSFVLTGGGGAIRTSNAPSGTTILRCTFRGNNILNPAGEGGGAVRAFRGFLTIQDSLFEDNFTLNQPGGAVKFEGRTQSTLPVFSVVGSTFRNNRAFDSALQLGNRGGAIATTLRQNIIIDGCTFEGNTAQDAGHVHIEPLALNATIRNSTFTGGGATPNSTGNGGDWGAIYANTTTSILFDGVSVNGVSAKISAGIHAFTTGTLTLENSSIRNCQAIPNAGGQGGDNGGALLTSPSLIVRNTTFENNQAKLYAGLHAISGTGSALIESTIFRNNRAASFPGSAFGEVGGLNITGSALTIRGNTFDANQGKFAAGLNAGGQGATLLLEDNHFTNNQTNSISPTSAGEGGGARINRSGINTIRNNRFLANTARRGGGLWIDATNTTILNNLFAGNTSIEANGGGLFLEGGGAHAIINSTIANNTGGGLFVVGAQNDLLHNSIIWGNSGAPAIEVNTIGGGSPTIPAAYSLVEGGYIGTGNLNVNPGFTSPATGDFTLAQTSPAIDAGNNTLVPSATTTDLAGNARFVDVASVADIGVGPSPIVDMGAFETPDAQACDSIDFNNDNGFFDPTDIDAFLSVFSEGPCIPSAATCSDIDFNNDGGLFDPCDIDSFLLVFSEGPCTPCGQ